MLCENCGKNEANVHYTQIINGVKKEISVCSDCAKKLGLDEMEMPINFNSFLGDFFSDFAERSLLPSLKANEVKCKTCGTTYNDFINDGLFGCEDCYTEFERPINSLLKNLHGTDVHIGRKPGLTGDKVEETKVQYTATEEKPKEVDKKAKLQAELDKAVKEERYEDAAKLRDQLKEVE